MGRRSFGIARQSVVAGMELGIVAMVFAALGYISPISGALPHEAIDVALNLSYPPLDGGMELEFYAPLYRAVIACFLALVA